ncbi:hypothetical protein PR048_010698 [Dryococelus australis]|uniref:HTH CENPB-type domain-containing protein n=1 Tax=Dryococelus australis TaxID=614101 RepID=A0ABQ9I3G0_9NEOP|nr:hypothetical protein PR048_010698 [Dryococelus australis]
MADGDVTWRPAGSGARCGPQLPISLLLLLQEFQLFILEVTATRRQVLLSGWGDGKVAVTLILDGSTAASETCPLLNSEVLPDCPPAMPHSQAQTGCSAATESEAERSIATSPNVEVLPQQGDFVWHDAPAELFFSLYKEKHALIEKGLICTQKQAMNKFGYAVTAKQIENSYKTLERSMKTFIKNTNKTRRGRRAMLHQKEVCEMFISRHNIIPKVVSGSRGLISCEEVLKTKGIADEETSIDRFLLSSFEMPRSKYEMKRPPPKKELKEAAVKDVIERCTSLREAADKCNISKFAITRSVVKVRMDNSNVKEFSYKPQFDVKREFSLEEVILNGTAYLHYGLTTTQTRILAYEYAKSNLNNVTWREKDKMAGISWLRMFRQCHPELLRKSKATSWHVHTPPKILAAKGTKQIGSLTSGEHESNVTIIASVMVSPMKKFLYSSSNLHMQSLTFSFMIIVNLISIKVINMAK